MAWPPASLRTPAGRAGGRVHQAIFGYPATLGHPNYGPPAPGRLVSPAEDEPLSVGGRQIAPNAQAFLGRPVGRNAARGGRGLGLDLVLALGQAAVEG